MMLVTMMDLSEVRPYEKNAKKHPDEQVEHIANSIREFGWQQPLVVDKDNVLVIGHGRLLAAKKLELKQVPVVRADDLTPEQISALRLADNKTNESGWDVDLLEVELEGISEIDMSMFGFKDIELESFFNDEPSQPDDKADVDKAYTVTAYCADADEKDDLVAYLKDHNITYEAE